jgi:formate dehydrogenase major subunit
MAKHYIAKYKRLGGTMKKNCGIRKLSALFRIKTESPRIKACLSLCRYCSGGCGVVFQVRHGRIIKITGDSSNPINKGKLCPKGASWDKLQNNPRRITTPRIRLTGANQWQNISWDDAITRIARKIKEVRDNTWDYNNNRTDAIGVLGSATIDNEECYLLTKFIRLLGSNYIEHQARV